MGVILRTHLIQGESHIQRDANQEVATIIPSFCNEPYRLHILFVKVALSKAFTSWLQHYFVVIGKPGWQVHKALHYGSKQQ